MHEVVALLWPVVRVPALAPWLGLFGLLLFIGGSMKQRSSNIESARPRLRKRSDDDPPVAA